MRHKGCEPLGTTGIGPKLFSPSGTVARSVRIVYCHACGAVSTNVWGERDICTHCGHSAERMDFHRPWQSYVSGVILLVGAAVFIWGPITDTLQRGILFVAVLAVSLALGNWGLTETRRRILAEVAARSQAEGRA